jgi:hypothetical protein
VNLDLFQQEKTQSVVEQIKQLIQSELTGLPIDELVESINEIRQATHDISPFKTEPVDFVRWVKNPLVHANDYNPNSVAPPEMELLRHSIAADGYTQPIVSMPDGVGAFEVIDGFHRHRVGKEKIYPRFVSLNEIENLGWSHTQLRNYNADVPRLRSEWEKEKNDFEKRKSETEKANKEFLELAPKKYSQLEKLSLSFSSLSTQETFWLVLRLVFGFFISIMLVALFENLQRVMKPLEIEVRKVDSVEVEAIQKMALLKTDRHWKFRDPRNILKNFPLFPLQDGLKIIYEARNATRPQKPAKTRKVDVVGICGSSAGETPTKVSNVVFFPKKLAQ